MDSKNIKTLLSEEYLVVPEIQREYVWGLESNKDKFLYFINDIEKTAKNSKKNIGFLYTYHAKENECYIIDGQQRFTTIILLMYVLALKEGSTETWKMFGDLLAVSTPKLKFSYNVRPLTEEFLHHLFNEHSFNSTEDLKDKRWYINAYNRDITISAIVQALKTLMSLDLKITLPQVIDNLEFWYFKVEETSQGEELYISMNSRGKKLAMGEQIKPLLIQKAKKENGISNNEQAELKAWDDIEDWFFSIRRHVSANINVEDVDNYSISNIINMVIELTKFEEHRRLNPIKDYAIDTLNLSTISEFVSHIKELLGCSLLEYRDLKVLYTKERDMSQWLKLEILMADRHSKKTENKKRLIRILGNTLKYNPNSSETSFLSFAELISKKPEEKKLMEYMNEHRAELELSSGKNTSAGFIPKEEMEKIVFLADHEKMENIVVEAENYAFFDGRIHFLYHDEEGNTDWEHFETKFSNSKRLFDSKGAKDEFGKNAYIQRLIISFFDKWEYFSAICFDNTKSNLHSLLLNNSIKGPISKALSVSKYPNLDGYQSEDNMESCQKQLKNEIVGTEWIEDISEGSYLRNPGDKENYHFFQYNGKANWRHYYLVSKRNSVIRELTKKGIIKTEFIMDCGFCFGDYIYFSYRDRDRDRDREEWFKWTSGNRIYYTKGKEEGAYRRPYSFDNDPKEKKYFCINVSCPEMTTEALISKLPAELDRLISEKS